MTQDVLQPRRMDLQHHLTRYHPTHVEKVVDDLRLDAHISRNCFQPALEVLRLDSRMLQELRPSLNGVEWRPQFMRQSRQKLIFQSAHPFGLSSCGPFGLQEQLPIRHERVQFRYVMGNLGSADDIPGGVQNGRYGQRYMYAGSVLAQTHRLVSLYAVPVADLAEDAVLLRVKLRRDDAQDGLADHLLGCKSEKSLRRAVPRCDDSLQRLACDRILR